MAAPTYTARTTLAGNDIIPDGFKALITLAVDPDILLWEKEVTPFGVEGGDPIPQTTMHNGTWHTDAPQQLKRLTPLTMTCGFNLNVFPQIVAVCNVRTTISMWISTGHWIAFFGYLQNFLPSSFNIGNQPEASCTFVPTNWDPVAKVEAGPAYGTAAAPF